MTNEEKFNAGSCECRFMDYKHPSGTKVCYNVELTACNYEICPISDEVILLGQKEIDSGRWTIEPIPQTIHSQEYELVCMVRKTDNAFSKYSRYSTENEKWLEERIGQMIRCTRHNINYVRFENGFLCHLYDCTTI